MSDEPAGNYDEIKLLSLFFSPNRYDEQEPPLIKELLKDSFFDRVWWDINFNEKDRSRVRQFIVEKQLSRQGIDETINKIRTITGEAEEKISKYDFRDYLVVLPVVFRLLELEKTSIDALTYVLEASYDSLGGVSSGLKDLDRLLQYFSLEDLIKIHKEVNLGTKENFNDILDFGALSRMLTYHFSILSPYKTRREDVRELTEDERKTLSLFVMNKITELSKKGANNWQIIDILNDFDNIIRQFLESEEELVEKSMMELYSTLLTESKIEDILRKYGELGLKYDKDGERIWEFVRKIPSVQELSNKWDFESKHDFVKLERLYCRACREQEIIYSEFIEVMNTLEKIGSNYIDFNDLKWSHTSADFLGNFHLLKNLIKDTKNKSLLREYIKKRCNFSWLVKNLEQVNYMLSLGIQRETALRMDMRSYEGVKDAQEYLKRLVSLKEIIDDQKYQKLISAVQMLLDSHANLPLVGLALTYVNMGYIKNVSWDEDDNIGFLIWYAFSEPIIGRDEFGKKIIKDLKEGSPVKNPQELFEESKNDPRKFLLYILNEPVKDAITHYIRNYIRKMTERTQRRGKRYEIDDESGDVSESEEYTEGDRKISFYGTDLERLEKIISEYTLKSFRLPHEGIEGKKASGPRDIVVASNVVSRLIPNFLNKLPKLYRDKMDLEQVLGLCEKELKQQSGLSNIMEITIKKGGIEQTVGEYVRSTIEDRYEQLR